MYRAETSRVGFARRALALAPRLRTTIRQCIRRPASWQRRRLRHAVERTKQRRARPGHFAGGRSSVEDKFKGCRQVVNEDISLTFSQHGKSEQLPNM